MTVTVKNVCRWGSDTSEGYRTLHINGTDYEVERTKEGYIIRTPACVGDDGLPVPAIARRLPLSLEGDGFFTRALRAAISKRPYTESPSKPTAPVVKPETVSISGSGPVCVVPSTPSTPIPTPSNQTDRETQQHTHQGMQRRGHVASSNGSVEQAERRIHGLEEVAKVCAEPIWMLRYDIPDTSEEPNPSHLLWYYGFRDNLSCWVIPQRSLDRPTMQALINHWRNDRPEMIVRLMRIHDSEIAQIHQMAVEALSEEIRRVHTSLIQRIGSADEKLAQTIAEMEKEAEEQGVEVSPTDEQQVRTARMNKVRGIIKLAATALDASISCAKLFDETESVRDLLQGLREAILAESRAFNASEMVQRGLKPATTEIPTIS